MSQQDKQMDKKQGDLLSSLGSLVGMVATGGNPLGAVLGGGLGTLLGGGSVNDAMRSGVGSLLNAGLGGKAGVALSALNALGGGGGSNREMGGALMGALNTPEGQRRAAQAAAMGMVGGGPTAALTGILTAGGMINPKTGNMDPLVEGVFRTMLDEQRKPRFDQLMSDTEQRQYSTGERLPDYRGTVAPGTPSMAANRAPRARPAVNYRAQGGYIEGPGTGTSDSIPAMIYQNGGPVQEARLSDGEFVMTADAVRGAGGGNRAKGAAKMYQMMNRFEGMA